MKLSTRSRYGTRMILFLAECYNKGPVSIGKIAEQLGVSVKYLEQLVIPLRKAGFMESIRGPKGGHVLSKSPRKIHVGEVVTILEGGIDLSDCISDPSACQGKIECAMRGIWKEATEAMFDKLNSVTFAEVLERNERPSN